MLISPLRRRLASRVPGRVSLPSRPTGFAVLFGVALAGAAPPVFADCVFTVRPATAEEKKIHADGFALFQRMAPAPPAGWTHNDSPKSGVLTEVCAPPGEKVTRWGFSRGFSRTGDEQQRLAEELRQVEAIAKQRAATAKANEAKLAEVKTQMDAAMKKMQALAAEKKYAELEGMSGEIERLVAQQQKLMGAGDQDAALQQITAASRKDTSASFSLTIGEMAVDTRAFKPAVVPVGKGYRQDFESNGLQVGDFLVVLPGAAPGAGQTVVRVSGDPARAEALLKAAKLR